MSYGFSILFKQVNSKEEAMEFALKVTDSVRENALERIQNAKYFIPSHVNFLEGDNKEADENWLYSCFTNCFTYWEKYHLLGMFETRIPSATRKMFDSSVYFQNSTDQNYDYERWNGISFFEETRDSILNMTQRDLINILDTHWCYDADDEERDKLFENIQNDEYYRKSAVYNAIFDKLDLDTWMDDEKTSDSFIRFNFCAINGGDTYFKFCNLLKMVKIQCKEEME